MFKASSQSIHRIESPRQFYGLLKQKITQAKRRIFLATLYVGKEEKELAYFLCKALARNRELQLTLLMDAMRATRESPKSISSASLLSHLASMFPDQVDIRLYATPVLRPGSFKARLLGKRFNEGFGLQHMKIYGFDNDVIISGANLSRDYFTRRKDRYVMIHQHAPLADYLHSLILLVSRFSYAVHYAGDAKLLAYCKKHIEELDDFSAELSQVYQSPFRLTWDGGRDLLLTEDTDGTVVPSGLFPPRYLYHERNWRSQAHQDLMEFTQRWQQRAQKAERPSSETTDTCVVPLLQMGQLNISQETNMIPYLINFIKALRLRPSKSQQAVARPFTTVDITSGYFTLSSIYRSLVLSDQLHQISASSDRLPVVFRLVAASPEANGFFGSRGITNRIPAAYTYMESQFWNEVVKKKLHLPIDPQRDSMQDLYDPVSTGPISSVELREWRKYGWTYHSKGLWLSPPTRRKGTCLPCATLIGSSNYGARSETFDLECSLLITTHAPFLRQTLATEVMDMREDARDLMNEEAFQAKERRVDLVTRCLTHLVKYMM
ncbi:CDP-diacylglycerol--glycerol-3-phosphate 1-phosphatidyltransferase [Malassezia nana]|uniref:CDP-diacylglycerol--glycerol-3-phosphate 3-phosphatidyltransferase n=1 Tax=Malassezia nana TaxID=180528 RepID=A0AAF0J3W8_9BASI|nr:CDP-diacylglycerol--glycerol-3-phosphate 1-phosphatidyltransferase [Malassezia nana]